MNRNIKLAAAIAAVLSSGAALAQSSPPPSVASAAAPTVALYISGSSAAKNAIIGALESATFCGGAGTYDVFSSTGDTNFFAVSCIPPTSTGLPSANGSTNVFTIWYRDEGGSVTGALPLVTGSSINQMSLGAATGTSTTYTVSVPGASATNGIDDSFASNVFKAPVQLGITDVEPAVLIKNNYPSAYKTSVYGKATAAQLGSLTATTIFDQVFGIFVNTSSGFTAAENSGHGTTTASLVLPLQTIQGILQSSNAAATGKPTITNWNKAPGIDGSAVTAGSVPIVVVNREQGSGSRTATDLFFTGDECVAKQFPIYESTAGTADYFSTGNVLAAADLVAGSITYASIDNAGSSSYPNMTLVAVNGVQPTNLAAAAGEYNDWFEATAVINSTSFNNLSADQQQLIGLLEGAFQTVSTTPGGTDVLANPNYNQAALPITNTASFNNSHTIYVNPFSRGGASCSDPSSLL